MDIDPLKYIDGSEAEVRTHYATPEQLENMAREAMVKALVVGDGTDIGNSNSLSIDEQFESLGIAAKTIIPPYNPLVSSTIPEKSTRLARAISAWTRNTVGLGWKIVPRDYAGDPIDLSDPKNKKLKAQFEQERKLLLELFRFPNREMPFTKVMELIKYDEEATGTGYLEVVRDNTGRIVGLYHTPAVTTRSLKDNDGFVQIKGLQFNASPDNNTQNSVTRLIKTGDKPTVVFFKNFGDPRPMHKTTGARTGRISIKNRASEIIPFKLYTPRSSAYGIPRYVSAAPYIAGNRLAAERNVTYFLNDAVPRAILTVTGGKLDPDSVDRMTRFFKQQAQGVQNAGRVLILQVTPKQTNLGKETTTSIDFKPITVGVTEDASFIAYESQNNNHIREVMELAEVYYSVDTVNRASAESSRAITEAQSFEPDRVCKEFLINNTIVADPGWRLGSGSGPGMEVANFEFERPRTLDPMEAAQIRAIESDMAIKTVNELRIESGLDPYPEDMAFGNKPLVVALAEMTAQVTPTTGDPDMFNKIRDQESKMADEEMKMAKKAQADKAKADLAAAKQPKVAQTAKSIRDNYLTKDAIIQQLDAAIDAKMKKKYKKEN